MEQFKHKIPVQIRFSDIDRLDHVNNACYHNFVELGRVTYFKDVLTGLINWDEKGFILARTEIDHLEPIFINDEVFCFTKIERLGNKSMTVKNAIYKKNKEELIECAAVTGILVAMDYKQNMSIEIPAEWRKRISEFERL